MSTIDTPAAAPAKTGKPETKRAVLNKLMQDYPVLAQHLPLKIGITQELLARSTLSSGVLKRSLRYHLRSKPYLLALSRGGLHYNLDGHPVGEVTREEQQQAREILEQRKTAPQERKMVRQSQTEQTEAQHVAA